jgi:hypothetical protein
MDPFVYREGLLRVERLHVILEPDEQLATSRVPTFVQHSLDFVQGHGFIQKCVLDGIGVIRLRAPFLDFGAVELGMSGKLSVGFEREDDV